MRIEDVLRKKEYDVDYFMSILSSYEEDSYIKPVNNENHYNVFQQLFEMNLVVKNHVPIWNNGNIVGSEMTFLYNLNLDYSFCLV